MQETRVLKTPADFTQFAEEFKATHRMPFAYAIGLAYKDKDGNTIANKWLSVNVNNNFGTASALLEALEMEVPESELLYKEFNLDELQGLLGEYFDVFNDDGKYHENIQALSMVRSELPPGLQESRVYGSVIMYPNEDFLLKNAVGSIGDAHFRLAAMSQLRYKPNTLCLDKIFETLPILHFTAKGVYTTQEWNEKMMWAIEPLNSPDKFPFLGWGAPLPIGVRMPNPQSARLGAYLSPGTTIMPYGFVNFNAGTFGRAMIEGTVAAGVTIDDNTDIGKGGGCLGTLSGGNTVKITLGKNNLIGALAECGVSLGDNCVVASGVCFTANTPFWEVLETGGSSKCKASHFSGKSNITFRRSSDNGRLEVIQKGNKAELDPRLHA